MVNSKRSLRTRVVDALGTVVIALAVTVMLLKAFLQLGPREFREGLEEAINGRKE